MSFKIVWASCDTMGSRTPAWLKIRDHAPKVFISQGDTPYVNGASSGLYGVVSSPAFTASTTQADALVKYQQFWSKPTAAALLGLRAEGMLAYYQPDDHEWADDNWDHTPTPLGGSFTTQALVNQHWQRCNDALTEFLAASWDNPVPNAAGNTERPSGALAEAQNPATTNYPIKYFALDFNANGAVMAQTSVVRIIFLDCISYRSPVEAVDDASKRMLGAQQEAWLEARLLEAVGVPYVLISSTKKLFRGTSDNADTFGNYTTERDRVLAMIAATGVKPIWLSGDRHTLHVMESRVAAGGLCDLVDLCACPIGVSVNGVGDCPEIIWKSDQKGFGLITVGSKELLAEIREGDTGSILWSARFLPGSNTPIYAEGPAAFRLR